jgi:predicted dehydrogenase
MSASCVRVGVVGVGALGQHHARVYAALPGVRLVGVHDLEMSRAATVAARHECPAFRSLEALVQEVDALSVAVPTVAHHDVAAAVLEAGKDVLIEKPLATTLQEADALIALAARQGRLIQVGHVERFNPATETLLREARGGRFIEVHRLGAFPGRSLDIDVVLDLMIHDLDILLTLDDSAVVQVDAVGVPVLTGRVDIANVRLRFASGMIANLTASRVSQERVRKFRVFSPGTYVSVDFASREARVFRLLPGANGRPELREERTPASNEEPLARQLAAFVTAVRTRARPVVNGEDGRRALDLGLTILGQMQSHSG